MPHVAYLSKNFHDDTVQVIAAARVICEEYAADGYDLTLRQLYYQFVARGWLENSQRAYKRLGSIVNDARMTGHIDWDHLVDRTRNLATLAHWDEPSSIIEAVADQYRIDKWADQDHRVEVWVEKEALAGVIERTARALDVPYFSCRGYVSQSEMWRAGRRLGGYIADGKHAVILHLGDHDPSGIDMTRDIEDRLFTFTGREVMDMEGVERISYDEFLDHVTVRRIALNWEQVEHYDPPPNPAKVTDSRAADYIDRFGYESWELDALDPRTLDTLIREAVDDYRDLDLWGEMEEREEEGRESLVLLSERYNDVVAHLEGSS